MSMNSTLKDKITNICGIVFAICTFLVSGSISGLTLPSWMVTTAGLLAAVSGGIIGYFTGKKPDGTSVKSNEIDPTTPPPGNN